MEGTSGGLLFVIILLLSPFALYYGLMHESMEKTKSKELRDEFRSKFMKAMFQKDLVAENLFIDLTNSSGFTVTTDNRVCIYTSSQLKVYSYEDLLSVDLVVNNTIVTQTKRMSQIGGAILGGAVAGMAGAVIGGLSGEKQSETQISYKTLQIVVNDISHPVYEFPIYNRGINPPYEVWQELEGASTYWYHVLSKLIREADRVEAARVDEIKNTNVSYSPADKLKKWKALLDDGVITSEEFNRKRDILLKDVYHS